MTDKILEVIVRKTVEKRMTNSYNRFQLSEYDVSYEPLKQVTQDETLRIVRAKDKNNVDFTPNSDYIHSYAYNDGLFFANKLLKENRYNLEALFEVMKLIPNSVEFVTFGKDYGFGFLEGLFGWSQAEYGKKKDDLNIFIGIWRQKLIDDFFILATEGC